MWTGLRGESGRRAGDSERVETEVAGKGKEDAGGGWVGGRWREGRTERERRGVLWQVPVFEAAQQGGEEELREDERLGGREAGMQGEDG
eukprot:237270-Rhodomonas_salina.2